MRHLSQQSDVGSSARIPVLKLTTVGILAALGFVLSPILRVPGMAPMQHFINVICAVLVGPWYALLCAIIIAAMRMTLLGIDLLAVTGAVFGAFLSGVLYRRFRHLMSAVVGEVLGMGVLGALASWPVMKYIYGAHDVVWFTYLPSFILGTVIGGMMAFIFLVALKRRGILTKMQRRLDGEKR